MERKRSRTTKGGGKDGVPARRRNEPSPEEIERHLREAVIVRMEPILAGTAYWGLAEAESANVISAERDPKRKKEMIRRCEELAVQLKDLSRKEREQILFEEITKWKKEAQG
jgi:transcriptional regulator of NAD metabolism